MPSYVKVRTVCRPGPWNPKGPAGFAFSHVCPIRPLQCRAVRVLVTGGSGFLGSYVAEGLSALGHTVRALVRPRSDKKILEKLPGVEFAAGAIEDRASLDALTRVAEATAKGDQRRISTQLLRWVPEGWEVVNP